MRKITFFFAMLLMCFSAARVSAQGLEYYGMTPLITDASMLESPFGDPEEGLNIEYLCDGDASTFWHTDYHGQEPDVLHWVQANFAEPISGDFLLYMLRRAYTANDHPTVIRVEGSNDGEVWTTVVDSLALPFQGAGTAGVSDVLTLAEPTAKLRITVLDCTGENYGFRLFWHAAELQLYAADNDESMVMYLFNNVLALYDAYLWGETMDIGNNPGQYSNAEAWEAFMADLKWVDQYLNGEIAEEITAAQADEIVTRIEANFQAVLDSKVPLPPVMSGYYFVVAAMPYYNSVIKLDENGDTIFNAETQEPEYETVRVTKALHSHETILNWSTLDTSDCNFLFRIDHIPQTGNYGCYACATDGRLNPVSQSNAVTLDPTLDPTESEVALTLQNKDAEGREIMSIARADQNSGFTYLHEAGHNDGTGTSGNVVGWESTAEASHWYLVPVEDAAAQVLIDAWAPMRDRNVMLQSVAAMKADGLVAMEIARDIRIEVTRENPLLTDASQLSSPYGDPEEGQHIEYLCDGDASTFWHSNYHEVNESELQWLQLALNGPVSGEYALVITRRSTDNDHPTAFRVEGSADGETWTHLGDVELEFSGAGMVDSSTTWTMDESISFLRFMPTNCVGVNQGFRLFWHAAEFQAYPAKTIVNPTSQMAMLGELYTNLEAAIAAVPAQEDDITVDHYTALKEAYDAFMAKYVDPTPLRNAIDIANDDIAQMAIGTAPGYWTEGAEAELNAAIEQAQAYDKAGVFDTTRIAGHIATLQAESDKFFAKANKVDTGKWYRIRLGSQEEYTANGWDPNAFVDSDTGMGDFFGHCVYAATHEYIDDIQTIVTKTDMEVTEGSALYFAEPSQDDGCLFRFIALGDTAYTIQNKATGLYIHCGGANSNDVTLGLAPSIFRIKAIGKGQLLCSGESLQGASLTNLHVQNYNHRLVTWDSNTPGSNSGMFVDEVDDVDIAALTNTFVRNVNPGRIYAQCWPVSVSAEDGGMYTVAGTYTEGEKNFIALSEIETAEPGMPFLYIHGVPEDWAEPVEGEDPLTEEAFFIGGNEVVAQADSINGLVGTFVTRAVEKGTTVFTDNMAKATTEVSTNVAANGAFLRFGQTEAQPGGDYDLVLEIDGEVTATAIENVLSSVAKAGNVYDLNGRLVRTNATLNDVKALGRGMYILNGTKVLVK